MPAFQIIDRGFTVSNKKFMVKTVFSPDLDSNLREEACRNFVVQLHELGRDNTARLMYEVSDFDSAGDFHDPFKSAFGSPVFATGKDGEILKVDLHPLGLEIWDDASDGRVAAVMFLASSNDGPNAICIFDADKANTRKVSGWDEIEAFLSGYGLRVAVGEGYKPASQKKFEL